MRTKKSMIYINIVVCGMKSLQKLNKIFNLKGKSLYCGNYEYILLEFKFHNYNNSSNF